MRAPPAPGPTPALPARRGPLRLGLLVVLLAALLPRWVRLGEVRAAPDFEQPAVDAAFHDWWARSVAGLELAGDGRDPALLRRAYLRPPGYPWFLGAVYASSGGSHLAARLAQLALGLATAALVWSCLARTAGPLAGLLGGLFAGLHWLSIYFEGELQAAPLASFLLLLATRLWLGWWERAGSAALRGGDGGAWRWAGLAGLALGAAAITRPNALFVAVAALALGWAEAARRGSRPVRFALPFGLGLAAAILPVTARNLAVAGEPVLISTNAGVNLYIGNHERATGLVAAHLPGLGRFETCFDYPELARRVEREAGRELSDREVSAWFTGRALEWIRAHPGRALELLGLKALLLLGPHEVPHNKELALERASSRVLPWLPFRFPALFAAAIFGWALARRDRGPRGALARLAGLSCAAWLLSVLPFFVAARYRVPVLPWLGLLAAMFAAELARSGLQRRWHRTLPLGLGYAASVLALSVSPLELEPNAAKWHHDRGRAWLASGQPERALAELEAALTLEPSRSQAQLSRANALVALGRRDEALAAFRSLAQQRPRDYRALNNLGALLAEAGRLEEARGCFERALELDPRPAGVHLNLGRLLEQLGRPAQAAAHYRAALELGSERAAEARRALRRLGPPDGLPPPGPGALSPSRLGDAASDAAGDGAAPPDRYTPAPRQEPR